MAMKWEGFSEEDITKMKIRSNKPDIIHQKFKDADLSMKSRKKSNQESSRRTPSQMVGLDIAQGKMSENAGPEPISKVSRSLDSVEDGNMPALNGMKVSQDSVHDRTLEVNNCSATSEVNDHQMKSLTAKLVLPSLSQPPPSSINLSDFKTKHRLMEEQNRARKVFLAKALEDSSVLMELYFIFRKKQTHAEQVRLGMIQEELQKLDQRLSCDVSIIRNQIDAASHEFMEAQKRYDRAEKEFLDAKLLLYTKLERKELLTHHLCTIIEQNEIRKAQKLSELMEKLHMPDLEAGQSQDGDIEKQQDTLNPSACEPRRKVSSEIILTPTSVVPQCENSGADDSNHS
ncbi:hypothetical protein ONE63_010077 [Megalurothrips usitatus]|uniref:RAB6-interacting golgin n=1 Tax=Megalurothrips usitatus TaxID=439358 RepID=A0AAV7XGP1_9NEOP|nr:hypothetical protein ONE63_010077 [Megalurothrips usitatus]